MTTTADSSPSPLARLDPRRLTRPAPVLPLAVLAGFAAMRQFETASFNIVLPDIRQSFHLSLAGLSLITAVTAPFALLLDIPFAYAADRVRRVRLTCVGFAVFMVFSALTGLAGVVSSLGLLYLARAGAAAGGAFESTQASLMADFYPVSLRPKVYFYRAAIGAVMGAAAPATVGLIELRYSWQAPFLIFAIPTLVFVLVGSRLAEPVRGRHEREMMGADPATAAVADEPASVSETFRTLFANTSMRRVYYALPFLTVAAVGIGQFTSLYYQQIMHLDASGRGFVTAVTEPGAVLGLVVGGSILTPLVLRRPGTVVRLVAVSSTVAGALLVGFALAPNLAVAVLLHFFVSAVLATIIPAVTTVLSLVIPPRMRSLGFATGSLWLLLGLPFLPVAGAVGDAYGLRAGIVAFVPVFLIGAYLMASGGSHVAADIDKVRVSTLARAELRRARLEGRTPLLTIRGLRAGYAQPDVLFDVNLDLADGEMLALLGTNGAGKSTLLRAVSSLITPRAGAVVFDGAEITTADPRRIVRLGVVHVPGGRGVFAGLSVLENLGLAAGDRRRDRQEAIERALDMFPALRPRLEVPAGELSGGEQQMLTLAQAVMVTPRLLLIDELTLGLAPVVVDQLVERVRDIHQQGAAVVLVDQSLTTASLLCPRAAFMERGEVVFEGRTADLAGRDDIARAVFLPRATGPVHVSAPRRVADGAAAAAVSGVGLRKAYGGVTAVSDVDISVGAGEVVGLIGPNGAGKTTVLDLLGGAQTPDRGAVRLGETDVTGWPTHRRSAAGLARSFQDPRLWPGLTVKEILAVGVARRHGGVRPFRALLATPSVRRQERRVAGEVDDLIDLLNLHAYRLRFPGELSTGTRRVVELATVLAQRPSVVLFDEPTAGVAQRETEPLARLLDRVRHELGCAMLIVEHDMAFVRDLADRVVAMHAGRVIADGSPESVFSSDELLHSYLGADAGSQL